jgi:integrase
MRVRLKGLNSRTKPLADGTIKTYWYAWKGGPPLRGEPGTPEFIASYNAKVTPPDGVLLRLLQDYQASDNFRSRRDRTRHDYVQKIKRIERDLGDFPLSALTDRRTRGVFMEWRDKLALSSRRQADYAWQVLALVLAWAKERGKITVNPCERGGRLYRGNRVDKVWTDDDEAAFLRTAPAHLRLPLLLALWTGQRQGDLLRLTWSAYDGSHIRLRQSKTGVPVRFKVGAPLKAVLDATAKVSPLILVSSTKRPWTAAASAPHGASRRQRLALSASPSTICAGLRSRGLRWSAAPRPRLLPSPGTACATSGQFSTPTICTVIRSSPTPPSPSSKGEQNHPTKLPTDNRGFEKN